MCFGKVHFKLPADLSRGCSQLPHMGFSILSLTKKKKKKKCPAFCFCLWRRSRLFPQCLSIYLLETLMCAAKNASTDSQMIQRWSRMGGPDATLAQSLPPGKPWASNPSGRTDRQTDDLTSPSVTSQLLGRLNNFLLLK